MSKIIHVVAMTSTGLIGINNKLPFTLKEDLQRFKELTEGKLIVMGYNTFKSIHDSYMNGKTEFLPGRNVVVCVANPKSATELKPTIKDIKTQYSYSNVQFMNQNLLINAVDYSITPVVVVGGAKLFSLFPNPTAVFSTIVHMDEEEEKKLKENSNVVTHYSYFDSLTKNHLEFKSQKLTSSNNLTYQYITYI